MERTSFLINNRMNASHANERKCSHEKEEEDACRVNFYNHDENFSVVVFFTSCMCYFPPPKCCFRMCTVRFTEKIRFIHEMSKSER
jgi:uncharacterized protein YkuJ